MITREYVLCIKSVDDPDSRIPYIAHKGSTYELIRTQTCKECGLQVIEVEGVSHSFTQCDLGPNPLPADHFIPLNRPDSVDDKETRDLFLPAPKQPVSA
jgi:hypothetical protein